MAKTPAAGEVQLNGSGSTFVQPLFEHWAYNYSLKIDPGLKINYGGGGSGQGKKDIIAGTVDFAGSDSTLTDDEFGKKPMQHIPAVAGAIVPAYNLPGVKTITLDGDTLGKIYAGKIEKWNDAAIAALNRGVALPNLPIVVVHRSDGSGTTNVFTIYLTRASKDWADNVKPSSGTTVDWPADKVKRGLGGKGNQGVAATVQKTRGAIGYIELAYAVKNKIPYGKMINAAGKVIDASPESTTAAMQGISFSKRLTADIENSAQADAWPISGFAYFIIDKDIKDCVKAQKLLSWITWSLTSGTGKSRAKELLYATLPPDIVPTIGEAIKGIKCNNGNPVFK